MVRKSADQGKKKKKPAVKQTNTEGKTLASKSKNPVLREGHPQDVAHPATAEEAESDTRTEYIVWPLLSERPTLNLL